MTPIQCKMARVATGLTVRKLGEITGLAFSTINRYEKTGRANISTVNKMIEALEAAGVEFIPENGGGVGVRLRK
ncbi:helix-turn-helix transcriptional regulator [Paremcibacter congregatus]|uniref:helix-turn-helix domain-containing protein n=1 Tax=Paremcibacter congregatus TaxID=2043170 RepID=UPI0030EDA929